MMCSAAREAGGQDPQELGGRYQVAIDAMKMTLKASDLTVAARSCPDAGHQGSTAARRSSTRGCIEEALFNWHPGMRAPWSTAWSFAIISYGWDSNRGAAGI